MFKGETKDDIPYTHGELKWLLAWILHFISYAHLTFLPLLFNQSSLQFWEEIVNTTHAMLGYDQTHKHVNNIIAPKMVQIRYHGSIKNFS